MPRRRKTVRAGQILVGPDRRGRYQTAKRADARRAHPSKVARVLAIPKRRKNPGALPFVLGTVTGAGIVFFRVGGSQIAAEREFMELTDCQGGILLVSPTKRSAWERGIDFATGSTGYSHCALYLCMKDGDENPLVVDCQSKVGVQIRPITDFHNRKVAWISLNSSETAHARGAALSRLGLPYRGRPGGVTCSEFVESCLPMHMKQRIRDVSRVVTPNTIARAFDVKGSKASTESANDLAKRLKF